MKRVNVLKKNKNADAAVKFFDTLSTLDKKYTFKKYTLYKKYTRSVLPGLVTK